MKKTQKALIYLSLDFVVSYGIWLLFFLMRRLVFENESFDSIDQKFIAQLIPAAIIAFYWIFMYSVAGLYSDPYRKSRLREFFQVLKFTVLGMIIIFFLIFLDDPKPADIPYQFYFYYFFMQFLSIAFVHFVISTNTNSRIRKRQIGFPTIIVGSGKQALKIWNELNSSRKSLGFDIRGFVSPMDAEKNLLYGKLKRFGDISRLREIIASRKIEEVIIAMDKKEKKEMVKVIQMLEGTSARVKIVPGIYDYIMGTVKTTHIMGSPLIEIFPDLLSTGEKFLKRSMDLTVSTLFLLVFSPVYIGIAIAVKLNSKGPIFFMQERIGKGGLPFKIIKFRTMFIDAEKFGPALSSENDPRITRVGKILRKTRLDEIPQFWNVIRGDMSLVGPRPERQFFIDQIVKKAPHYRHLHRVRPGITSWGQVKFGYAENVDEMVERLTFDILYIENMSLLLDIKIILYTVIVMIEGRGK